MKFFSKLIICAAVLMPFAQSCKSPDADYVHTRNTISSIQITMAPKVQGISGIIEEYCKGDNPENGDKPVNLKEVLDEDGNVVEYKELVYGVDYTQEQIEGGFGIVRFELTPAQWKLYDVTNVFITSSLDLDVICEEGFVGRHDLTYDPENNKYGKTFTMRSGVGTKRQYRIYAIEVDNN
ncbi:MAG: hypothetical protein J1F10_02215 [Muribaculaceae bacterium]|nr:hypothetical protein [Muribaculaceae bacterium]